MSDAILDKILGRRIDEAGELGRGAEGDGTDDLGCFGWLRGARDRCLMLELRKKTGLILAVGYSWLEYAEYDPSVGITLHVAGRRITIQGRNLNGGDRGQSQPPLFQGLTRHRVPWVSEAGKSTPFVADASVAVVESISW